MEPLGKGRAEARSRLSVQRRVQRCCARLSSSPAPRSAVPAAPNTDRQLSPQGNMASLRRSGGSERAGLTCSVRKGPRTGGLKQINKSRKTTWF